MKGWVYVMSNQAMPGLVKVGYSTKDPELRAEELNHTGIPHPYLVDYEMLVESPYSTEQESHEALADVREGKEWFRCTPEHAIAAIRRVAGDGIILENYKHADRKEAERLQIERDKAENAAERARRARHQTEERFREREAQIRSTWNAKIEQQFPTHSFYVYWVSGAIGCFVLAALLFPGAESEGATAFLSIVGGAVAGVFIKSYFEGKRAKNPQYLAMKKKCETEIKYMRLGTPLTPDQRYVLKIREMMEPWIKDFGDQPPGAPNPTAVVTVFLYPNGVQTQPPTLTSSSGNTDFDRSTLLALRCLDPFPAPPSGCYPATLQVKYSMFDPLP